MKLILTIIQYIVFNKPYHGYIAYTCSCGLFTTCIAIKEGHFCNILIMLFLILNVLSFIQSDQIKENNLNRILNLSLF